MAEKRIETNVSTTLSASAPYHDDFNTDDAANGKSPHDKNFLRILFKPGVSVQARELNQIQTAIQAQIDKLGRHVFRNNSAVLGGEFSVDNDVDSININNMQDAFNSVTKIQDALVGTEIRDGATDGLADVKAYVTGVKAITDSNELKLFLRYVKSTQTGTHTVTEEGDSTASTLAYDKNVFGASNLYSADGALIATVSSTGKAARLTVEDGVFFTNGSFVVKEKESIFIDRPRVDDTTFIQYEGQAILQVNEVLYSAEARPDYTADVELFDNSAQQTGQTTNTGAPGADRYAIDLQLHLLTRTAELLGGENTGLVDDQELYNGNSVKLIDIVNNETAGYNATPYNMIGDYIESRTFEESGNYTVNPFRVTVREHLNDGDNGGKFTSAAGGDINKYLIEIDPSTAYIQGRRIQFTNQKSVVVNKVRTATKTDETVSFQARKGNYIEGITMTGVPNTSTTYYLYLSKSDTNRNTLQKTTFDNSPSLSNAIGSCKVRTVDYTGQKYRAYITNLNLEPGFQLKDARFLSEDSADFTDQEFSLDVGANASGFILKEPKYNSDIYPIGYPGITNVESLKYTARISSITQTLAAATGTHTFTAPVQQTFFSDNINDYIVVDADGIVLDLDPQHTPVITGGGSQIELHSTIAASATVHTLIAPVKISTTAANIVLATMTNQAQSTNSVSNAGVIVIPDNILTIDKITSDSGGNTVVTSDYEIDIRASETGIGNSGSRLIYRGTDTAPATIYLSGLKVSTYNPGVYTVNSFNHDNLAFSGHSSGSAIAYRDIPSFEDQFKLSDGIDFRNLGSNTVLDPNSLVEATIDRIQPRIDCLVLNKQGEFKVIEGIPADNPIPPISPPDVLKLATIVVPPFGAQIKDFEVTPNNNRRYTMQDINKLERRISNLEFYTSTNELERNANEKQILDGNGLRFKNGILTDAFTGHGVGNVYDGGYRCAMDELAGELRPLFTQEHFKLKAGTDSQARTPKGPGDKDGENATQKEPNARLNSNSKFPFINQRAASVSINVNPYAVSAYLGEIELSPSSDEWKSTVRAPDVIVNSDGQYDQLVTLLKQSEAFGTVWGEAQSHWTGSYTYRYKKKRWYGRTKHYTATVKTGYRDQRGVEGYIESGYGPSELINESIINLAFIPFVRSRRVYFKATNLKPNTRHIPYLNDIDISKYTVGQDEATYNLKLYADNNEAITYEPSEQLIGIPAESGYSSTAITSDDRGEAYGFFVVPNNDSMQFRCGTLEFKLIDSINPDVSFGNSYAIAQYPAVGTIQTLQKTFVSTKTAEIAFRDVYRRLDKVEYDTKTGQTTYKDPLAQSFLISGYPGGIMLSDIDLYFDTKDPALPVNVYIVTMENGIPTQTIVPYSQVIKNSDQVITSNNASLATNFKFKAPVYLQADTEYALVVASNATGDGDGATATGYKLWVGEVGGIDITTSGSTVIAKQPYAGVFFKSQNASTWTEDQNIDMKFTMNAYNFFTDDDRRIGSKKAEYTFDTVLPVDSAGTVISPLPSATSAQVLSTEFQHPDVDVSYSIQAGGTPGENISCRANEIVDFLNNQYSITQDGGSKTTNTIKVTATMTSRNEFITPMINLDRFSLITYNNEVTPLQTSIGEDEELSKYHGSNCTARYISRVAQLDNASTGLDVYVKINRPTGTEVRAYARFGGGTAQDNSPNSDEFGFIRLDSDKIPFNDTGEFSEVHFQKDFLLDGFNSPAASTTSIKDFTSFQIKFCMGSGNAHKVPKLKELRAIATA